MEKFNATRAIAGELVVSTSCVPARIICWDKMSSTGHHIVALVRNFDGEAPTSLNSEGVNPLGVEFYMAPKNPKWVVVNRDGHPFYQSEPYDCFDDAYDHAFSESGMKLSIISGDLI